MFGCSPLCHANAAYFMLFNLDLGIHDMMQGRKVIVSMTTRYMVETFGCRPDELLSWHDGEVIYSKLDFCCADCGGDALIPSGRRHECVCGRIIEQCEHGEGKPTSASQHEPGLQTQATPAFHAPHGNVGLHINGTVQGQAAPEPSSPVISNSCASQVMH